MNIPAFPAMHFDLADNEHGMTLRDYFAAKAMVGLMGTERAQEFVDEEGYEMIGEEGESGTLFIHTEFFVKEAYMIADMMLKAREA